MKKIICMFMSIILVLLFCCGCGEENTGPETYSSFIIIEQTTPERNDYLAYHKDTKVVYELSRLYTNQQNFVPYQIYKNGVIYGAVYEDGEIKPAPYAIGLTDEMIKEYLDNFLYKK